MTKPKAPRTIVPAEPPDATLPEDPCAPPPEVYDPADYRWVPVRRRPRYDGWTEEKQRRFIEALADTGVVSLAARAVGMSRESANRLRRAPHAAAFARAWGVARAQAGSVLEDVAFERALEGVEHNVYDEDGAVVCTKRVFNDRLLMFLLRNLKPERYGRHALERLADRLAASRDPAPGATIEAEPCAMLTESLAALEPVLPAPATELLDPETLEHELEIAGIADGELPHFLNEQRPAQPELDPVKAAKRAAVRRGEALDRTITGDRKLTDQEHSDWCAFHEALDPLPRKRKRFR